MMEMVGAFFILSVGFAMAFLLAYLGSRSYWKHQADYWKRRSQVLEDRVDALDAQICRLRGLRPLTKEEVETHNRRVMSGEFHSEVRIG